jgi:hypothetical protein
MNGDRAVAIIVAVIAGLGLPFAGMALVFSPMLYDSPNAGGWPLTLLFVGLMSALPCLIGALILGTAAAVGKFAAKRRPLLLAAIIALAAPVVLIGMGALTIDFVCHGRFECRNPS